MAFRGWRLFGLAGTIFVYVAGILLLSIISLQNSSQRRPRMRSLSERDLMNLHRREMLIASVQKSLKWCRPLTFIDGRPIKNQSLASPMKSLQTFPGHFVGDRSNAKDKANVTQLGRNQITYDPRYDPLYSRTRRKMEAQWNKRSMKDLENNERPVTAKNHNEDVRGLTALVSFPGSGNTWLRYLLQQSTGVLTGSVYKDLGLMKSGFPAESISNSSVLAVKTHEWGKTVFKMFSTAILLVRDPKASILAEFNRQSAGHVGYASVERFTRTEGRYWHQFVINKLWLWEQTNLSWANDFPGRLKVVFYDDLVSNLEETLRDILQFIGHAVDDELLKCTLSRKEGIYRRRKRISSFDPFTKEMHENIAAKTKEIYGKLGRIV